jgi:hypothetical protein
MFVGTLSAQRVKKTFSDDAPILNFCRTFGHHRLHPWRIGIADAGL